MKIEPPDSSPNETTVRGELAKVAQEFVFLQQARHDADYNLEKPLDLAAAMQIVDRAHSAFASWNAAAGSPVANEYLFSLLFKERERV